MYQRITLGILAHLLFCSSLAAQVIEDQTGAAFPSNHVFLDRLDYTVPGAGRQVPKLSSKPGASTAIYLDFNGDYVTRTAGPYETSCFRKIGGVETLDANDVVDIVDVFAQVAEMFRPFDVNVTTKLLDFLAVDVPYRTWALCTPDHSRGLGGFFGLDEHPALFPRAEGPITVHELGHSYGSNHAGYKDPTTIPATIIEYYLGHDSDISAFPEWNAYMGDSRIGTLMQWTKGEYFRSHAVSASSVSDNVELISRDSPFRADDHGDDIGSATVLSSGAEKRGVIEKRTDKDTFRFTSGPGPITIDVLSLAAHPELPLIITPSDEFFGAVKPALDLSIKLYDAFGEVAASNPLPELDAQITFTAPEEGVYTLSIEGTGVGDPLGPSTTGYTDYGSLGSYLVTASFPDAAIPELQVTSFTSLLENPDPGNPATAHIKHLTYSGQVKNLGGEPVGTLGRLQLYKHYEPDLSNPEAGAPNFEDLALTPSYWVGVHVDNIPIFLDPADGRQTGNFEEVLEIDTEFLPDGIYYLYAYGDDPHPNGDAVSESDETNNVRVLDVNPAVPGAQGYVLDRSGG